MSFMLTTEQVRHRAKTVTRRTGWHALRVGDTVQAVEKGMGLKKGERIKPLARLTVVSVRQEPLRRMLDDYQYGREETDREGFPHMTPERFVAFFCRSHRGVTPDTDVTRIEFEYQ